MEPNWTQEEIDSIINLIMDKENPLKNLKNMRCEND